MPIRRLLIANRGEIAVRIARAAADLGIATVAVAAGDEHDAPHLAAADESRRLPGRGPAAYLDSEQIVAVARAADCDALHPGYGFLSESVALAEAAAQAGLILVGPGPDTLARCGNKAATRRLAVELGVPVPAGSDGAASLEQALAFRAQHPGALMLKAVAGGGGRGMRVVGADDDLAGHWQRCASEAQSAFGSDALYVEVLIPDARHIEVQLLGDGQSLIHLWERDCSAQRRHQKLIELAPAPALDTKVRDALLADALAMGQALSLRGLATVEFLVAGSDHHLIEINPRLQVEHPVTEQVTGVDLVQAQLAVAGGASLAALGLSTPPPLRGAALELRLNAERLMPDGNLAGQSGRLERLQLPSGPGVRVDTAMRAGATVDPRFDSLLAKLIVSGADWAQVMTRAQRALRELEVAGCDSNRALLEALLAEQALASGQVHNRTVDAWLPGFAAAARPSTAADDGLLRAPMPGRIVAVVVEAGSQVEAGQELLVIEAMKMEHVIAAPGPGSVEAVLAASGETVAEGQPLLRFAADRDEGGPAAAVAHVDLDLIRSDLADLRSRLALTGDESRPAAIAKRHALGFASARENIAALCDPDSFVEYGALAIAMQRSRRKEQVLREETPADGLVCGIGRVNGDDVGADASRCAVLAYDYTVLAGTQGGQNHRKTDRMIQLAREQRLPLVFFTEGGGGRPGDTDAQHVQVTGLECSSFAGLAGLAGRVPLVGIANGRCFAGNAAFLGCCDVIIATEKSNIGMGGPAMIAGGGLGEYAPEDIGPLRVQRASGVVDIAVANEAEAVTAAQRYLGYFQGAVANFDAPDPRRLRQAVPENRLRAYDMREALALIADTGSVLELRPDFGPGMLTALARIGGRPVGIVANNPLHLAGAIDSPAADKGARFMRLCNAFGLPLIFLCDTPGIMVGPEAEKSGTVRHASRLFLAGAQLSVPFMTVVLRKAYGLGAQAMFGGHLKAGRFAVAWPTGEFGPMGLEGAVQLGFRRELAAIKEPAERQAAYERMVEALYARGKAVNVASHFEIDAVIDPAETRDWLLSGIGNHAGGPAAWQQGATLDVW